MMKTVMIVIDGLGDDPIPALDGKTPLEAAYAPGIHYIASRGRIGRIATAFPGYPVESLVCIMGLLGYSPEKYYPTGRASFEAMAKGIHLNDEDLVFRCNIVTVDPATRNLTDFTAGMITDSDARKAIVGIKLPHKTWELYPGQSYRNILIHRGVGADAGAITCFPPHMHIGASVREGLPRSSEAAAGELMAELGAFLAGTHEQIAGMDLPETCRGNSLWVWSPSTKPSWPSFKKLTGMRGACVGGLDFLHGMAMAADMHFDVIPGATGYIDTDYRAKAEYAKRYIKDYDFVMVHINAADEEAHQRNHQGKIDAIQKIDRMVVGPVLDELQSGYRDRFRVVVCGDHKTRCSDGKHMGDPVPYALFGCGVEASGIDVFGESRCEARPLLGSLDFLKSVVPQARS